MRRRVPVLDGLECGVVDSVVEARAVQEVEVVFVRHRVPGYAWLPLLVSSIADLKQPSVLLRIQDGGLAIGSEVAPKHVEAEHQLA